MIHVSIRTLQLGLCFALQMSMSVQLTMAAVNKPAQTQEEGTRAAVRATSFCRLMDSAVDQIGQVRDSSGRRDGVVMKALNCCSFSPSHSTTWYYHPKDADSTTQLPSSSHHP